MNQNRNHKQKYDVLIVDDAKNNVILLQDLLHEFNYSVRTASNGMEAYKKIVESRPDLILLDIMMPHLDGFELINKLKDSVDDDIPVIFITAKSNQEDMDRAYALGANDYIVKPVNIADVIQKIEKVLKN